MRHVTEIASELHTLSILRTVWA